MTISEQLKKDLIKTVSFHEGTYFTVEDENLAKYFSKDELELKDESSPVVVVYKNNSATWTPIDVYNEFSKTPDLANIKILIAFQDILSDENYVSHIYDNFLIYFMKK